MSHAGTTVSDRYRHRLRGQLEQDAEMLDDYLRGEAAAVIALPVTGAHTGAQASTASSLSGRARAS
jgi:hypothetical protein